MRRVLLVQPSMQPPGGGNGVAAWVLQALARHHHVTVLTWRPVEVAPINRFFGTELREDDFATLEVPRSWTAVPDHLPVPATLLKLSLIMRYTRRVSSSFDVIFGVHNETDFGRRGIQYIHYPTYLRPRPHVDLRWYHSLRVGLSAYYSVADRLAGFSMDRLRQNVTLVNSNWTGAHVKKLLGIDAETLYPPIVEPDPPVPWAERAPHFLAVGRISPEKKYENIMRILARVRRRVPDLRLTIVGTADRRGSTYFRELGRLATSLGTWIELRRDISRRDLRRLMATYRYGIHGMHEEHFGMGPAELVVAGAIVWMPRGGGQVEIVGDERRLLYDDEDDAVEKIMSVLDDPAEQSAIRERLGARRRLFSTDRFVTKVRETVATFRE